MALVALLSVCNCWGQSQSHPPTCATHEVNQMMQRRFPALKVQQALLQKQVLKQAKQISRQNVDSEPDQIVIPVAFHIVFNHTFLPPDRAKVLEQLKILNDAFAGKDADFAAQTPIPFQLLKSNTGISFCLGQYYNQQGKLREAITYTETDQDVFNSQDPDQRVKHTELGGHDALNPAEYLNIWVTRLEPVTAGYATFPGYNQEWEGVVMNHTAFGITNSIHTGRGKTLAHEVGHYLFLRHTWGDEPCGTDFIDDTPPAAAADHSPVPAKLFPYKKNSCVNNSSGEMYTNYMSYHPHVNRTMFTHGQAKVMRATLAAGGTREGLLYSKACLEPHHMATNCCPDVQRLKVTYNLSSIVAIGWQHEEAAMAYEVRHRAFYDQSWSAPVVVTKNEHEFTGLLNEKSYFFQVRVKCASGQVGSWRTVSSSTFGACISLIPEVFVEAENTHITLRWNNPKGIDFLEITLRGPVDESGKTVVIKGDRINATQYTFSGLMEGTDYEARILWNCLAGELIAHVGTTIPWQKQISTLGCKPPTKVSVFQAAHEIVVTSNKANPNHVLLFGQIKRKDEPVWRPEIQAPSVAGVTFTNLEPSQHYDVRLRTICLDGSSSTYRQLSASTLSVGGAAPVDGNATAAAPAFVLYPNPALQSQTITIEQTAGSGLQPGEIILLNSSGEVLRQAHITSENTIKLVLGKLAPGLYLIMWRSGANTMTKRLLITK